MGAGSGKRSNEVTPRMVTQGILALLIFPLALALSPAFLLVLIIRFFVWLVARACRPDLDGFVTGFSAIFTCWPDFNVVNCNSLDGKITTEEFRSLMQEKILCKRDHHGQLMYMKLKQTWTYYGGYIFWRTDENFKLENHIRDYDYTGKLKISSSSSEEEVRSIANGLIQLPWKEGRSPWEILLISMTKDPAKPRTLVILRIQHVLLDGYSLSELWKTLGDLDFKLALPKSFKGKRIQVHEILRIPYDFAGAVIDSWIFRGEWYCPAGGNKRDFHTSGYACIPVGLVKEAKEKLGTSYIAVVFSAVGGAIQRMFREAQLPIPEVLTAMTPIPKPNHPGGMTNHLIFCCFKWPIKAESTIERTQKIQAQLSRLASSPAIGLLGLTPEIIGMLPAFASNSLANILARGSSTLVSCFPVPEEKVYFYGREVISLQTEFGMIGKNMGVSMLMSGVNSKQEVVLNMDKRLFPSEKIFQLFGEYVEEEVQSLISG